MEKTKATIMKMNKEAKKKLEKERKSWKEDARVQMEGFKDRLKKVLMTVQDKEVELRRLKEMVVDQCEGKMAAFEGITKEISFKILANRSKASRHNFIEVTFISTLL